MSMDTEKQNPSVASGGYNSNNTGNEMGDRKQEEPSKRRLTIVDPSGESPPTSYIETIIHLFKGNIGPGLFAMGDAFMNGGLVVAPVLTLSIAIISVHCQHMLIHCSEQMRLQRQSEECADYAETVEQVFESGPKKLQSWSKIMKTIVNIFIVVTQLGFCCIYFVFITTNFKQILKAHDIIVDIHLLMLAAFVPILLSSLITTFKWLAPVSLVANICMITGLGVTIFYAVQHGLPHIPDRHLYTNPHQLALFFGTAIFAFEGIALVLPLKNSMRVKEDFERPLGVLNVGMVMVTSMFMFAGFVGYMKWGEDVLGSLTLNLGDTVLAQCVKAMVSCGVLFGYPLQFFIAIQIMLPSVLRPTWGRKKRLCAELGFRTMFVIITLGIAELVPALSLFISLIGSLCSTALALVFPPMIQLIIRSENSKGPGVFIFIKNILILILALMGFSTGTFESLKRIVLYFGKEDEH